MEEFSELIFIMKGQNELYIISSVFLYSFKIEREVIEKILNTKRIFEKIILKKQII